MSPAPARRLAPELRTMFLAVVAVSVLVPENVVRPLNVICPAPASSRLTVKSSL